MQNCFYYLLRVKWKKGLRSKVKPVSALTGQVVENQNLEEMSNLINFESRLSKIDCSFCEMPQFELDCVRILLFTFSL
jgi:hypothetical protein